MEKPVNKPRQALHSGTEAGGDLSDESVGERGTFI